MGRIVRRFARFFEQEMRGNFEQGVWGTGIIEYEADQVLNSIVLATAGIAGDPVAAYVGISVEAAHVGDVRALRVRNAVDAAIVQTGFNYGIHLECEILAAGDVTGNWNAHQIEMWSPSAVAVGGSVFAVRVVNVLTTAPVGDYCFMRFSETGGADVTSAIMIGVGGGSDITDLLTLI